MKKFYFSLILICLAFSGYTQTTTFTFNGTTSTGNAGVSGTPQAYTVPAGASKIGVDMWGAAGGWPCCNWTSSTANGPRALGGRVQCTMNVTPGTTLWVYVGGQGGDNYSAIAQSPGGWNGGAAGGSSTSAFAASGGGASDIRLSTTGPYNATNVLVVAGAGGGGGDFGPVGGAGGGVNGGNGNTYAFGCSTAACGGGQTGPACTNGYVLGTQGQGGVPGQYSLGGGGGGWWGGNSGACGNSGDGSGGGGSSYPPSPNTIVTNIIHTQGYTGATSNGQVVITVLCNNPGTISGANTVCNGSSTTFSISGNGVSGTWVSNDPTIASVGSASGIVTGVGAGVTTITYSISSPCGGASATKTVTVLAVPSSITGTLAGCQSGPSSTLSSSPSGGTWTSSNTSVATVGASSGVVSPGSTAGTTTITYDLGNGCSTVTAPYTVNSNPAAITGTTFVCGGSNPTTSPLSDATTFGTWSSSNTAVATIGAGSGTLTGVSGGTATISYTLGTGCFSTTTASVNAVANISGAPGTCVGNSITLTDATGGGVWSSSTTSVATIGSSTGIMSAIASGSTTITYTVASLSCSAIKAENVSSGTPNVFAVTGGGSYCAGGAGVHVGLVNSDVNTSYSLFNGGTFVPPAFSTGSTPVGAIDFGAQTAGGTYTVVANFGTGCATTMTGSVTITVNPLPTAYSVGGGGSYCAGGSGVNITLSSTQIGVNYQLYVTVGSTTTAVGSPVAGTGSSMTFGPVTTVGTYTIVGTNGTTGCINNMAGSAAVSTNALPTAYAVTGGGNYCLGGTGVHIGVANSTTGTTYQLLVGGSPVGSALSGSTGSSLDFGVITTAGTYTVLGTNTATSCSGLMSGSVVVGINPLPTTYTVSVTNGGAYCLGGSGQTISLGGSQTGVNYQLVQGTTMVGGVVAGTGASISFGSQTNVGSYTVFATNATTGCTNTMTGSASITTLPLPTLFNVTGGGGYCAGGSGVAVGLSGSTVGTTYNLYNGLTLVGAAGGTGGTITFGSQLTAGTYTVVGTTTSTGCTGNMSGSVNVVINPLPNVYTVTGGGPYCAGGNGVLVGLNGSNSGVNYQLFRGTVLDTIVPGNGSAISFNNRLGAGSYSVVAVNTTTACTSNMSGSVGITINPAPTAYAVTGGGGYCSGGSGVHIGLSGSNSTVKYQLMSGGGAVGSAILGVGSALDFGLISPAGTYTVTATDQGTGCTGGMSGSAVVVINALPTPFTVSGTGNYCAGGSGLPVNLSGSVSGVNYQLYNGGVAVGASMAGTGSPISFNGQTAAGTYAVVATTAATGCTNNMVGSATIGINPLPGTFAVTGGGSAFCAGGTGVAVGLGGSATGINYQLMNGPATVGSSVPGNGSAISFGAQTTPGTYTVVATDPLTSCSANMTGSAVVSISGLPATFTITGGGNVCAGGAGQHVGLSNSASGATYQLMLGGTPVGAPLAGTGAALDFGIKTTGGAYTVVATNTSTGCTTTMTGTATIVVNSLPAAHSITGGGSYCTGGTGSVIGLDASDVGVSYQLYNGATAVGLAIPGNGGPLNFGSQTATGIYTIVGTNTTTSCSANMTGSSTVGLYPLPTVYNVTGGGNYCTGGTGVNVGLNSSTIGTSYQLMLGTAPSGAPVAGTGGAVTFGLQTVAGPYTVVATNTTTGCMKTMNGTANVGLNALPTAYNVTGGGDYCTGGTGVSIGLSSSNTGIRYQLMNGSTAVGTPISGTGSALNFGLQTTVGTYNVVATNVSTTCTNTMTGSAVINIDPLPLSYTLTGGGNYCSGTGGLELILGASDVGVNYQLMDGATPVGSSMPGTGSSISFGFQTAAGTYTVVGTDATSGCTSNSSSQMVSINPLPGTYTVGGGGNYCAGGAGPHITLSGSFTGINYQLMNGGVSAGPVVPGSGLAIDFGAQTNAGNYTVVATNAATSCTANMTGSATVVVNPLPNAYPVSSTSSNYCAGGTGVHVWLNSSDAGINYQLYNGATAIGSPVAGTGTTVDFGFVLPAGSYTVKGINPVTGCVNTMTGGVAVVVNPLPSVFTVTGGGGYCAGSVGANVGLSGSTSGISYQLYNSGFATGAPVIGTGLPISFGAQTAAGNYTVVATNNATTCTNNMSGSVAVAVNPVPATFAVVGGGSYCPGTTGVDVSLNGSTLGVNYQLYRGGVAVGTPVAGTGTSVSFGAQVSGSYNVIATDVITGCTSNMAGSANVSLNAAPAGHTVTGGGGYCPGGSGVNVGLSSSDAGISYQLYNGTVAAGTALPGSGSSLTFGLQTAAGAYTVIATNTTTGCTNTMPGSAIVVINPVPNSYNVTGGGNYCTGGAGVHVGLSNSASGVNYTLFSSSTSVITIAGTGGPIDFGFETAGTYTVLATNAVTGCTSTMTGSATITVNPVVVPLVTISTGGSDTVCSGSITTFTANAVNAGSSPVYQWTVNGAAAGTGSSYAYVPVNGDIVGVSLTSSATCALPMTVSSSKTMTVNTSGSPSVVASANPGNVVCQGTSVTFTATPAFGGATPTYTWFKNGSSMGSGSSFSYLPANGDIVYVLMNSTYQCRTANTATSSNINMEVDAPVLPIVTIASDPGTNIAAGQLVTLSATVTHGGPVPTYQWLINGTVVPGANQPVFSYSNYMNNDSVTAQVLSSGGCSGLVGFNSVRIHVYSTGVSQVGNNADITLIPNPNKGNFTIKGTLGTAASDQVALEIINMAGQTVYTATLQAHNGELNDRIAPGNLANGMYLLTLRSGTETKVFHMVVEQ